MHLTWVPPCKRPCVCLLLSSLHCTTAGHVDKGSLSWRFIHVNCGNLATVAVGVGLVMGQGQCMHACAALSRCTGENCGLACRAVNSAKPPRCHCHCCPLSALFASASACRCCGRTHLLRSLPRERPAGVCQSGQSCSSTWQPQTTFLCSTLDCGTTQRTRCVRGCQRWGFGG